MKYVSEGAQTFRTEEDGNITIFSIFMLLLILAVTGAAVDIMRFEAVRAKMQSTMDRAVLAAADLDQQQDPVLVVNDYMNKAGLAGVVSEVKVEESANARTVWASGTGELNTIFLNMSGFGSLTAPARSTAEEKISNVEISLVLDISGSMRFNDRIGKMKPAAQDFVDKVMTGESNGVTTLNLVPFAGHVNPGEILFEYYRGERPKLKQNNGWGNGDQDAPGNSLCNNNAENADEGAADPSCSDGTAATEPDTTEPQNDVATNGYFTPWETAISNAVFYFDTDDDGVYNRAYKINRFPADAPRDLDDIYKGAVAFIMSQNSELTHPDMFLGASVRGGRQKDFPWTYFQVKGDENGSASDLGPTKNKGKLPGETYAYSSINYAGWESSYVAPKPKRVDDVATQTDTSESSDTPVEESRQNINMPNSCIEIYDDEFATTDMPKSSDYVPHFNYWPVAEEVMDWGWCPGEDTAIQYYSDDAEALKTFIADMRMHDGTGTQYGMKYGLALLDPNTRSAVNHLVENGVIANRFKDRPIAWNDEETEKFIVLLTDGQTTDQYRPTNPRDAINGEVALSTQGGDAAYTWTGAASNVDFLMQQCDLAKALGVTVFTIAYETNATAAQQMRDCASSEGHFFHAQGEQIFDTFDIVARQINNLRLIQ